MLKKFLLNALSSFVGAWMAMILFAVSAVLMVFAIIGSVGSGVVGSVQGHSILKIELKGALDEIAAPTQPDYMEIVKGNITRPQALSTIVAAIREAKSNKNVKCIYLECGGISASTATLNALRSELQDFKDGGKPVVAYGDAYSMADYYVASVADSLFMNPDGSVQLQGIGGTSMYLKNFFDKIGVQFEVVKVGTFKSAVEPYLYNEMSAPARAQLDTLYGNIWRYISKDLQASRKLKAGEIDTLINRDFLMLQEGDFTVKKHLIDRCIYRRQLPEILARYSGGKADDLKFVSPDVLSLTSKWGTDYDSKHRIAVVYAVGEIAEGTGAGIDCANLCPIITKLAEDEKVEGMVLRVNSPGGSVFGSSQIGEALDYFQSKGKVLAVSMGDYAASGGYWISAKADRIFADPMTVTGSIGIFGLIPNVSGLLGKIGVTPNTVATNPQANFPTLFAPMTEPQRQAMQRSVEKGYDRFVRRVAEGRKMPEARVRAIAEGRVWDGATAQRIGLVDALGGLDKAIEWTAAQAKISDKYHVAVYPEYEPSVWDLIPSEGAGAEFKAIFEKYNAATADKVLARIAAETLTRRHMQARMIPIIIKL